MTIDLEKPDKLAEAVDRINEAEDTPFREIDLKLIVADQGFGKTTTWTAFVIDDAKKHIVGIKNPKTGITLKVEPLAQDEIETEELDEGGVRKWVRGTNVEYDPDIVRLFLPNQKPRIIRIPEDHIIIPSFNIYYNMHLYGIRYKHLKYNELIEGLDDGTISNGWLGVDQAEIAANARDGMTSFVKAFLKESSQLRKARLHVVVIYTSWREADVLFKIKRSEVITCEMDEDNWITLHTEKKGEKRNRVDRYYAPQYWKYFDTNERAHLMSGQRNKAVAQGF